MRNTGRVLALTAALGLVAGCRGFERSDDDVERTQRSLVGPGLGNLTYTSGELSKMVSPIYLPVNAAALDGTTNGCPTSRPAGATAPGWGTMSDNCRGGHFSFAAMVNGYLVTPYINGGSFDANDPVDGQHDANIAVWNVSNPRNIVRVKDYRQLPASDIREAHAFGINKDYDGRTLVYMQSNHGIQIWDWSDVANNISLVADMQLPNTNTLQNYVGVWWLHLQFPYLYVADTDVGMYLVNVANPASPQIVRHPSFPTRDVFMTNSELGIPRIHQVHVIGNIMIVNYVENGSGVALFDISDPLNPVRTVVNLGHPKTYGTNFNGGRLAMPLKDAKRLGVYTIDTDANGVPTAMTTLGENFGNTDFGAGGYTNFQDNKILVGMSDRWAKFTPTTIPPAAPVTPYYTVGSSVSPPFTSPAPYAIIDMDFIIPMGNLAFVSNDDGGGGALMVHQTAQDLTGPTPNFVSPPNGATGRSIKSRVGLTFTDNVDINTVNTTSIVVRPVGGSAIAGRYSVQTGMVNFFPSQPLDPGTTYEVYVPTGGNAVRDDVGNTNPTSFLSSFTTAGTPPSSPPGNCSIGGATSGTVNTPIAFTGSCSTGSGLTFTWDFGDGSAPVTGASVSHTYAAPLHYAVGLTVTNSYGTGSATRTETVTYPLTSNKPTTSSSIAIDTVRARVYVVNTDASTVASIMSASPYTKQWEVGVGGFPRSLALPAPNGDLWVANQESATISVLNGGTGALVATISLPAFSRPYGLAFNPAGTFAYVTLEGSGRLVRIDVSTRAITHNVALGPKPRGVAVSSDGTRVLVTRMVSPDSGGEVWEVTGSTLALTRTFVLPLDTEPVSSESDGPGLPNYVQAVTITPDGRGAWVPSKKDNIRRGTGPAPSDGVAFDQDSRTRTIVSKLDLVANVTNLVNRRDLDNGDLATAVAFSDLGDYAFVITQGSERVDIYDALTHNHISLISNVGHAPRGILFSGNKIYVQNFMSRNVTIIDVSNVGTTNIFGTPVTVSTQTTEPLSAQVLLGKKIFYNAADARMSAEGYSSCASCHLDGDNDGRTWDFTQVGEGVRATASLLGRGGVAQQGPVHWTGNFDEIQDFENDMRGPGFGGTGFLSEADFALTSDTLGTPKAGRSAELDALAAYVSSLTTAPTSPFRNSDGTMTADAIAGQAIFSSAGCATCHSGSEMTDSALNVFHDVGTITAASGQRKGQPLTGFDTPTLIGVWATAPYLHDGSAATLLDVITTKNPSNLHGNTTGLTSTQKTQLVAYLQQLDDYVPPPQSSWTSQDVGAVAAAGSFNESGGTMTVVGSGADIWTTADEFRYAYQQMPGDGTIIARVVSLAGGTNATAKVGLMMRKDLTAGAINATVEVTRGTGVMKFQQRTAAAGTCVVVNGPASAGNRWLKLQRAGTTFTATWSDNGTTWNTVTGWSNVAVTGLSGTIYVGMSVTSHEDGVLTTGTFDNVSLSLPAAATPTFSVGSGTYNNAQSVTISSTTTGASIRYTLDGSTPTSSSALYSGPLTIANSNTTLKAIATKSGMVDSAVSSATYTLTVATPSASPGGGTFTSAQSVTLSSATTGATIYYTLDGSTPDTTSAVYGGAISIGSTTVLRAIGTKSGMGTSAMTSATYTLNVTAPTASPAGGTYNDVQSVTLSTTTSGASIYYTLDGSTPTSAGTQYTAPISITVSSTLRAIATKSGLDDSTIMSATYTLTAATPSASPAAGTYNNVQSVTLSSATPGASIYYTLDGSTPTTASTLYTGPVSVAASGTLKAIAAKGDMDSSAVMSAAYTLTVSTPTSNPAAGSYSTAQSVTLSTATSGASIYYTLDGSTPTTASTLYAAAINIAATTTVKAIAAKGAMGNSAVLTAAYTISTGPAAPTGLSATAGVPLTLSWTAPGGTITGYQVWRGTTAGGETLLASVGTSPTSYSDATVALNTTYYYKVRAMNGGSAGSFSSEVSAATGASKLVDPDNDTFVRDGTATGSNCNAGNATNCGQTTADSMGVKLNAGSNRFYFLRIPLSSVPAGTLPATTKVRLYGNCQLNPKTLNVYKITNTSWAEGTLTYTSASGTTPSMVTEVQATANKLLGVSVSITAGNKDWSGSALTSYIQTQKASNPTGFITLGVSYDVLNASDGPCTFNRRESASNKPQLRVE